jgi:archaeal flagellin FlaB
MFTKLTKFFKKEQKGITGLETAIILIAFVVVASIFAYTVLSAGLFSSQKSQEAIYNGLSSAQGTIDVKGAIIGIAAHSGTNGYISQISFTVVNTMGGAPVDFTPPDPNAGNNGTPAANSNNKVTISYIDIYQRVTELYWTLTKLGNADSDNLLEEGEQFQITVGAAIAGADGGVNGGNLVDALSTHTLQKDSKFVIEVKPPQGATLTIERKTPSIIDAAVNLN